MKSYIVMLITLIMATQDSFVYTQKLSKRICISPQLDLKSLGKKKIIFFWDLDKTLLEKSSVRMIATATYAACWFFIRAGIQGISRWWNNYQTDIAAYPELWALREHGAIIRACKKLKGLSVDAYKHVIDHYSPNLGSMIITIANQKVVIPETIALLDALSSHKHTLLTNQGAAALEALVTKYPTLFQHFSLITTVNYDGKKIYKKPDLKYYRDHIKKADPKKRALYIFIDDSEKNIKASAQAHHRLIGIQFDGNINHLKKDLRTLQENFTLAISLEAIQNDCPVQYS